MGPDFTPALWQSYDLHEIQLTQKYALLQQKYSIWSMALLTTSHMEHALVYHQPHGACPCLPPATWSMALFTTSHMEHALVYHHPHGACPCLPPATWSMPLFTTSHMEHVLAYHQPHGACPCLPQPQFFDMCAKHLNNATIFRKCGVENTGLGGLERHILKAN